MRSSILIVLSTILGSTTSVSALGSSCSAPLGAGTAAATDPFWLENMTHQGTSAFNPTPSTYEVFRNVKTFGAKGDGVTDDTAAINAAMTSGNRCGSTSCGSSTLTPAIVYFPSGTYVVSSAIDMYYYTQMIGDAKNPPTLLASAAFSGFAVIDSDPYIPGGSGAQWFVNQDNFYRSIRNLVIDLRQMPASAPAVGLHWQVSQATSLMNIVVEMSTAPGNTHEGMFMENGSGGFMGDLVFNGGNYGINVGNQQFTVRNLTINNAQTAVFGIWNWGWTWQGVTINDCQIGFDLTTGGVTEDTQTVGSQAIVDAVINNTPIFLRSSNSSDGKLAGSLVLNNIQLNNVTTAVGVVGGADVLAGGTTTIASWGQGDVYTGTSGTSTFTQGTIASSTKPSALLDSTGKVFGKTHPQYAEYATSQFVSVKSSGAKGDGKTDDTAAIQAVFDQYAGCKIIFFDAGAYYVTDTISIPAGSQVVGEAWSVILAGGTGFADQTTPKVVVQAGASGSSGVLEITDMLLSTAGPSPGAIMLEWNVADPSGQQGAAGLWDTHLRLGGAVGTNMQSGQCLNGTVNAACQAAFMGIHLTNSSTAYFEGTWVWTADHDLDATGSPQTSVFTGRGILSESAGPVWFIGTASEHSSLYQYNLAGAKNHWIGFAQTESPYYQPSPAAPAPFSTDSAYSDPSFSSSQTSAWGMYVQSSSDITLFGAGFYSFYENYVQDCLNTTNCQDQIFNMDSASASSMNVYALSTVGVVTELSVADAGVIKAAQNPDGLQDTATSWSSS
ncbi:glycoside hydrolase family 55 protein [Serpula lacrymans var. lacrymans S7.3]|uniref:Glycoside hydrolase family 55 protein n=1 Tax=Serpula lacrymans var. lacrymans (strain S7.3) TaxID=936435 RepID=F8QCB4_SERL3|nr:glycoside hydrolase family 55 protein [Serpula lacrymans var. lacrymans S7.3]